MALICPDCGFQNEASKLFCGACGEPLAGDARMIRDMEKMKEKQAKEAEAAKNAPPPPPVATADDDDYVPPKLAKKKDNTDIWLIGIALMLFFVICVCGFFMLDYFF